MDNQKDVANLDAGRALRVIMANKNMMGTELAASLGVSLTTVSTLRREKLMSGRNLVLLSNHFGISASEFIKRGEDDGF